jgi:hypothetical protein
MKFSTLFGAAIVFFSATALAGDMTYLSSAKSRETRSMLVDLPSGKSQVDVWGTDNETISCVFVDRGTGNVAYEATNVTRCVGTANLTLPTTIQAKITNNGNKDIQFRVWVRSTK